MKRFILAVILSLIFAVPAFAQDVVSFSKLNLVGDTIYLPSTGTFAVGVGTNIATIKDLVDIRGEYVPAIDNVDAKMGIGIGVNIVNTVQKLGGAWLVGGINTAVGITGLTNLNGTAHLEPAIYISILKLEY